jgi:class 3 adenylate cyclase
VSAPATGPTPVTLRPWQRLGARLAALFALGTLVAVGVVGGVTHERQRRELEDTVGTQLLNIARTAALLVDPALHAEVVGDGTAESPAYRTLREALARVQAELVLATPIRTLVAYDADRREARLAVVSSGPGRPGDRYPVPADVVQPLAWTLADGVARYTRIYRTAEGTWISAVAPVVDARGRTVALLDVDYPVDVYLDRLATLRATIVHASLAGGLGALVLGLWLAGRLTRPIAALTATAARVATGDLTASLAVPSRDEVGLLTRAFNDMVAGLRQRDAIRSAFGRYVSPEVAEALLASPDGLRLGGAKREVTILMADLRGYTRFAEQGAPEEVMTVLNDYLGRMADVVIAHGGTINEFIGDAIFAVFGAPIAHADHAARAAAAALAMQRAMQDVNARHAARGLPVFELGIGINTGDAVVGNIGSEQRAKYAVVGSAVNVAARVESATVGGQVYVTAATCARLGARADVAGAVHVRMKGLAEPLALYELRGLDGRPGHAGSARPADGERAADVELPLGCWIVDDKIVRDERVTGVVRRLRPRELDAALGGTLPPLTNVKLRLRYPSLGRDSADLYGKVLGETERGGVHVTRIRLTSIDPADEAALATLLGDGAPRLPPAAGIPPRVIQSS